MLYKLLFLLIFYFELTHEKVSNNKREKNIQIFKSILNPTSCGTQVFQPTLRIINGIQAINGSWPWLVGIFYNGRFRCGGSIISTDLILTAAHCVSNLNIIYLSVLCGTNDLQETKTTYNHVYASKIIIHPDYNEFYLYNDIALVRIKRNLTYTNNIAPICVPETTNVKEIENKTVYIAGW